MALAEIYSKEDQEIESLDSTNNRWYCIKTRRSLLPCDCEMEFLDGSWMVYGKLCLRIMNHHPIIIWPTETDENFVLAFKTAKKNNLDPKSLIYKDSFGPYVQFDVWARKAKEIVERL